MAFLAIGTSYYLYIKKNSQQKITPVSKEQINSNEIFQETKTRRVDTRSLLPSNKPSKKFKYTKDEVYNLSQKYPDSRNRLIEIATSADPYALSKIKLELDSSGEIQQEKFGALRVMALRALLDFESDKKKKIKNLNEVIQKSKDPVIKRVALSMLKSLKNDRDYTKDLLKAADE